MPQWKRKTINKANNNESLIFAQEETAEEVRERGR